MKKQHRSSIQRLRLDRQVVRYLRVIPEGELVQVAGGNSDVTDPECSRDCVPR
jgi:hypothetical protein